MSNFINREINNYEPDENGVHPEYKHLVWYDVESHYGSYIVTSPARDGSVLLSTDDFENMFEGSEWEARDGAFLTDEYLVSFENS